MRDFAVAVGGLFFGWWACDYHRLRQRQRIVAELIRSVQEPPSNVRVRRDDDEAAA